MIIQLPRSVRYPITITALLKKRDDDVPRLSPLFLYRYKTTVTEYPEFGEEIQVEKEFAAQFDAPIEGKLERWFIKVGSEICSEKYVCASPTFLSSSGARRRNCMALALMIFAVSTFWRSKSPVPMQYSSLVSVQCAEMI